MVQPDERALTATLAALSTRQLLRRRRTVQALPTPGDPTRVRVDGRELINFCSNDYLGLSQHPALIRAASECLTHFGVGAGASHLISGHSLEHQQLEQELAAFTDRPRALLFSTGYMANLGAITASTQRHDWVLADRACHASLLDAVKLAGVRLQRYRHADAAHAAELIEQHTRAPALIITDGVFSMDGDLAPLPALAALAQRHGSTLLVDDAHGLGVIGEQLGGALEVTDMDVTSVPLLVGTLGKAFGSFGAFVAGNDERIESVLQRARSYIYTTALPPAIAAATRAALRVARVERWRALHLRALVQRFKSGVQAQGLPLGASETPIQPLIVGDSGRALQLSAALEQAGFWVVAIRPPTVAAGTARLRITLSAAHQIEDVDALLKALAHAW